MIGQNEVASDVEIMACIGSKMTVLSMSYLISHDCRFGDERKRKLK